MWDNEEHDRDEPSESEWQRKKREAEPRRGATKAGDKLKCASCGKPFVAWKARQIRCQPCVNMIRQGNGLPARRDPETKPCNVCGTPFVAWLPHYKRCPSCREKGLVAGQPTVPPCPMCNDRGWLPTGLAHEEWGHLVTPCTACSPFTARKEEA